MENNSLFEKKNERPCLLPSQSDFSKIFELRW